MEIKNTKKKEQSFKQQLIGGFIWGAFMFLFMEIGYKYFTEETITTKSIMLGFVWWVVLAGGLFGVINYYVARYLKRRTASRASSKE